MRPIGQPGGIFISPDGKIHDSGEVVNGLPVEVLGSAYEEDVGVLEREVFDPEMDPELKEALENYDENKFEEIPDNFLELAEREDEGGEGITFGSYGALDDLEEDDVVKTNIKSEKHEGSDRDEEDFEDEDEGGEDEEEDEGDEEEAKRATNVKRRSRTFQDDMFDVALKKFERDLNEMYADEEDDEDDNKKIINEDPNAPLFNPVTRSYHASVFEHVFDKFLGEKTTCPYETPLAEESHDDKEEEEKGTPRLSEIEKENLSAVLLAAELSESSEEEKLEELFVREKRSQWDCESVVSTYSNLDNHPAIITETENRIKLNKRGFPALREPKNEEEDEDEEKLNLGVARQKNETLQEKKQRKKATKEDRRVKREKKKELKVAYREETTKQRTHVAGKLLNRTIIHP